MTLVGWALLGLLIGTEGWRWHHYGVFPVKRALHEWRLVFTGGDIDTYREALRRAR